MKQGVCEIHHNSFVGFFGSCTFSVYPESEPYVATPLWVIHDSPLFCVNVDEISTDIYSFGFIWAFWINRWRHPLPPYSLSSFHRTYLWYVSVQCANCALDTHPSGSVSMCVFVCLYCIFVCTVCIVVRFKAPRCCIMNVVFYVQILTCFCLHVYLYMDVCAATHSWHHCRPQPTGPSGPPNSAFCSEIIPPLPRPLPPSASQLSLPPPSSPWISATMPAVPV